MVGIPINILSKILRHFRYPFKIFPFFQSGHVVTIASAAGLFGGRKLADYCASKFAAVGYMESLAIELHGAAVGRNSDPAYKGAANVKTTVVCPYFIATGMFTGAGGR